MWSRQRLESGYTKRSRPGGTVSAVPRGTHGSSATSLCYCVLLTACVERCRPLGGDGQLARGTPYLAENARRGALGNCRQRRSRLFVHVCPLFETSAPERTASTLCGGKNKGKHWAMGNFGSFVSNGAQFDELWQIMQSVFLLRLVIIESVC